MWVVMGCLFLIAENPCAVRNGNCSHLCIPTGGGAHRCACPVNRELESDHQTCSSKKWEMGKGSFEMETDR